MPDDEHSLFLRGPVHLPLDLDLLDPTLAPGASHHEPGWFVTPHVIRLIQSPRAPTGGTDIAEYDPRRDVQAVSAKTATFILETGSDQE